MVRFHWTPFCEWMLRNWFSCLGMSGIPLKSIGICRNLDVSWGYWSSLHDFCYQCFKFSNIGKYNLVLSWRLECMLWPKSLEFKSYQPSFVYLKKKKKRKKKRLKAWSSCFWLRSSLLKIMVYLSNKKFGLTVMPLSWHRRDCKLLKSSMLTLQWLVPITLSIA